MVAGLDIGDAVADRLDHAGALVSQHRRRVTGGIRARRRVEIGVADAAGDEAYEHFARSRLGEIELLNLEGSPKVLQDCGPDLHRLRASPRPRRSASRLARGPVPLRPRDRKSVV